MGFLPLISDSIFQYVLLSNLHTPKVQTPKTMDIPSQGRDLCLPLPVCKFLGGVFEGILFGSCLVNSTFAQIGYISLKDSASICQWQPKFSWLNTRCVFLVPGFGLLVHEFFLINSLGLPLDRSTWNPKTVPIPHNKWEPPKRGGGHLPHPHLPPPPPNPPPPPHPSMRSKHLPTARSAARSSLRPKQRRRTARRVFFGVGARFFCGEVRRGRHPRFWGLKKRVL